MEVLPIIRSRKWLPPHSGSDKLTSESDKFPSKVINKKTFITAYSSILVNFIRKVTK